MGEDQNSVVTLKVRVTPEFREKIIESAKENSRSMNAEIVHRLEQSFVPATNNIRDIIKDMPLHDFVQLVFEKTNSGAVSLTIEEVERIKKAP